MTLSSFAVPSARPEWSTRYILAGLLALLLLWPLAACSPTAYPPLPPEKANRVEAVLRADIDLSKPVLLFFHADGVNDSDLMKPIFSRLEAIYRDKVSFRLLNVADPEAKRLWSSLSTKTPTLLLINREKGFVEQHDKYVKEEDLKALLEEMLAP